MRAKILLSILAMFVGILTVPAVVFAAPGWVRGLSIEWSYEPPADLVLSGFRLYQDGAAVCEWNVPTLRSGPCSTTLYRKTTLFTIAALFTDGQESPYSEPYSYTDWGPKPRLISVTPSVVIQRKSN